MNVASPAGLTLGRVWSLRAVRWGALVVALLALGYGALRGLSYAGRQRLASLGAEFLSPDPLQAAAVILFSGPRRGGAPGVQTLTIDFAQATDVAELRRRLAPLGEMEYVVFRGARPEHSADVAALIDSTQPQRLTLIKCETTSEIVAAIGRLAEPVELRLTNGALTTGAFGLFAANGSEITLKAFGMTFNAAALEGLMKCPRLHDWDALACTFDTPTDWRPPASASLARLVLRGGYPPRLRAWLKAVPHLKSLTLAGPLRAHLTADALALLPELQELALTDARLDDAWLSWLPELPQVTRLNLVRNRASVAGVAGALARARDVQTLRIDTCRLSVDDARSLEALYPQVAITFVPCQ